MHVKRKHEITCDFLFDRNDDDDECNSVDDYIPSAMKKKLVEHLCCSLF